MATTTDKLLIGGGLLAGIAALMWYGDKLVKDASSSFAKSLTLPDIVFPSFNPTINVPDYSKGINDAMSQAFKLGYEKSILGQSQNSLEELQKLFNGLLPQQQQQPLYNVNGTNVYKVPVTATGPSQPQTESWLPPITQLLAQGGIGTATAPKKDPVKSTSEGGNGIFVENGDKDYYVPDNSLYGGNSGMPAPVQEQPAQQPEQSPYILYGKIEDIREHNEKAAKAEAEAKLRAYEKQNNVLLPRGR